jgi:DNA-binding PadR family transcriptional regulator
MISSLVMDISLHRSTFDAPCSDGHVYIRNDIDLVRNMPDRPRSVDHLLPLKPKVLHILLALADGPRHGYGIMQEVAARSDGQIRIWPAAMYGTLRELEDLDLITETESRPSDDDERRRYFALTPLGKRVLNAEIRRLEAIVDHARASRAFRKAARA